MLFAVLLSCSTDKNTIVHRNFHNITARYNGFHYARESIKDGAFKLSKAHKDDYTRVLNINRIGDEASAKNIFPEMDKAYKKTSTVIQRHSIFLRGQEYCKWIDDNYLLIGISHYFKRDYFAALEIFEYITNQYKKEEIRYDAMVWTLKTYNEAAIVSKAILLIELIENDKKFPDRLKREFNIAVADFYLKQEKYNQASKALKKVVDKKIFSFKINKENYPQYLKTSHAPKLVSKREQTTRLIFILAQIYQRDNDNSNAFKYFGKVINRNPAYEMSFQAKMNQARSFDVNAKGNKNIKTQLFKMLKDAKNAEYFDQIYYSIAEIYFKENESALAVNYLKKSIESSQNNPKQKAFSFLKLADYYFKNTDYLNSFSYYDSALANLPKDYADFDKIEGKKKSLDKVVKNMNIISKEDSLQKIARMSEDDRDIFLNNMLQEEKKQALAKKKLEEEKKALALSTPINNQNTNLSASSNNNGSTWYFYNTASISMGYADFAKKWGDRTLEDNWRRKNKESIIINDAVAKEETQEEADTLKAETDDTKIDLNKKKSILKDLPLGAEQMKLSIENMMEAYYSLGTIYKEELNDFNNSISAFEALNSRMPQNKYLLPVYYQLYRSNIQINNEERAEYYKNILLNDYPESAYSKLIKNPDYAKETMASLNEIENLYVQTYQYYNDQKPERVISNCAIARQNFGKSNLIPRFELLNAMAVGKSKGIKEFEEALKTVIIKFPQDEVKVKAEELLAYLGNISGNKTEKQEAKIDTLYKFQADEIQNCIILLPQTSAINDLKTALFNFNNLFFGTESLTVKNLMFDAENQTLVISAMQDVKKGLVYLNALKEEKSITDLAGNSATYALVSDANLEVFLTEKKLSHYLEFFQKNYIP